MANKALTEYLRGLRRRFAAVGTATALGWALVTAVLLTVVLVWLDLILELSPELRLALSCAVPAAATALLLATCYAMLRRAAWPVLARRLDIVGSTRGQILSGVDLLLQPVPSSHLSAGLGELAIERAAVLADHVAPSCAVPARPIARAFGAFLLLCAGVCVLAAVMPDLVRTQWLRFTDPYGDHPPYSPIKFAVEPGNVRVLYGDGLDVRVTVTGGPVERVELVLNVDGQTDPQTLPMFLEPGGKRRGTIASVTSAGAYHVRARAARSHRFDVDVVTVPRLEGVRFRITPPAYTNVSLYEGALLPGGLAGLPGTHVELWAGSNRPLSGGVLEVETEEGLASAGLTPVSAGSTEVTGSFTISAPGKFRCNVIDVAGQPSKEDFAASIVVLPDQRPFVRVMEPRAVSFATPNVELPVAVSAEDDYGVARLQLYRSLNDSRSLPLELEVPVPTARRADTRTPLPLSVYGLEPGDVVKLFARVEDNDPAGPKGAESSIVQVHIISQEDFNRMIRTRQGLETLLSKFQQAQRRLEALAKQIERLQEELRDLPPDSELAAEHRERLRELAEQMQRDAEEIQKAAEFKMPYDIDEALTPQLEELARKLAAMAQEAANLASRKGLKAEAAKKELEDLRQRLGRKREQFAEQVTEPLEQLAAIYPLKEDEARFITLYQQQRELAERLASLRGSNGEDDPALKARMRDLEAEQNQLRQELHDLLNDIEDHVTRLPDDAELDDLRKTATEFAKALRASGAEQVMLEAQTGLAEFSGTRGHAGAKQAADILERFISQCNGMGDTAGQCLKFNPSLSSCLGNTVEQLLGDAGLGTGLGAGGAGGGYSARRRTLQNVGLYGALPALGEAGLRGSAADGRGLMRGAGYEGNVIRLQSLRFEALGSLRAAGTADPAIPVRYRRRVAEYYQRIADELGE